MPLTFGTGFFLLGLRGYGAAARFIFTSRRTLNSLGLKLKHQCPKISVADGIDGMGGLSGRDSSTEPAGAVRIGLIGASIGILNIDIRSKHSKGYDPRRIIACLHAMAKFSNNREEPRLPGLNPKRNAKKTYKNNPWRLIHERQKKRTPFFHSCTKSNLNYSFCSKKRTATRPQNVQLEMEYRAPFASHVLQPAVGSYSPCIFPKNLTRRTAS